MMCPFSLAAERNAGALSASPAVARASPLWALMRLLATPPLHISSGTARILGTDLFAADAEALRKLRGDQVAMIFQEPMTSLNPALRIGEQIAEAVREHRGVGAEEAQARALEMLERVRIPAAEKRLHEYPHQLSGGMRQRAMIAMVLANDPALLIADEPTTALDVTIQAQILDLMRTLVSETGAALILITHDLGVVAEWPTRWPSCMRDGLLNRVLSNRFLTIHSTRTLLA